jgi:hypothetical protein
MVYNKIKHKKKKETPVTGTILVVGLTIYVSFLRVTPVCCVGILNAL